MPFRRFSRDLKKQNWTAIVTIEDDARLLVANPRIPGTGLEAELASARSWVESLLETISAN
jgi:hypothetical protein